MTRVRSRPATCRPAANKAPRVREAAMRFHSASRRSLWLAGTMVGLLGAGPLAAQPPPVSAPPAAQAPAPLPPGSPLIGRPDNNPAAAKLAPIAPPLEPFADAGARNKAVTC